jgi:hypothetical protein
MRWWPAKGAPPCPGLCCACGPASDQAGVAPQGTSTCCSHASGPRGCCRACPRICCPLVGGWPGLLALHGSWGSDGGMAGGCRLPQGRASLPTSNPAALPGCSACSRAALGSATPAGTSCKAPAARHAPAAAAPPYSSAAEPPPIAPGPPALLQGPAVAPGRPSRRTWRSWRGRATTSQRATRCSTRARPSSARTSAQVGPLPSLAGWLAGWPRQASASVSASGLPAGRAALAPRPTPGALHPLQPAHAPAVP